MACHRTRRPRALEMRKNFRQLEGMSEEEQNVVLPLGEQVVHLTDILSYGKGTPASKSSSFHRTLDRSCCEKLTIRARL